RRANRRALRALLRGHGGAGQRGDPAMGGGVIGVPLDLNERAWRIADLMAANADAMRVAAHQLPEGARVIDAGIDVPGGYAAGALAAWVGRKAGLAPSQLTFVVAPTASLAGGVQIAARILETGLHKMDALGFDLKKIVGGVGTAPLPPVAKNDLRGIGRTNDCILYGGQARYTVNAGDAELAELVP